MNTTTQIPNWCKLMQRLREQMGETQTEFGEHFGVTRLTIYRWENGIMEPSHDNLRQLLNIDGGKQIVGEFYGGKI